jgi:molybdenum cofactor synthesis domain-containing protein
VAGKATVTACILVIGNEILSGRTQDANLSFLASNLNVLGIRVMEARVIPDATATIVATVNECRAKFDYVFTTGGIGPTHDDITAASIAEAFGVPLVRTDEALAMLKAQYPPDKLNEARLRMADTPQGSILLDNPVSRAPGFQVENVFVMPGVPEIMRAMFDGFKHRLAGGKPMLSRTVSCYTHEGVLADGLRVVQERYTDVEIGSYPFRRGSQGGVSLVARGQDRARVDAAARDLHALIQSVGFESIEDAI